MPVFKTQDTPASGSSRRHRGYQPDEVNQNSQKLEVEDSSTTQVDVGATNPTPLKNHSEASAKNSKLSSAMTPTSVKPEAPHRRTLLKGSKSNQQPMIHTQLATMDASRPALDIVHLDHVSKPIESETSSIQIITDRRPSCWSIATPPPPETPPTMWNSTAANIDRPARASLPIYRPKPQQKAERELASNSFGRQQAKLRLQATDSTPKAQKAIDMDGFPRLATPEKDQLQIMAPVTHKDSHADHFSHYRVQRPQHDVQFNAGQASKLKAIQDETLSTTAKASPEVQLASDELKSLSPTRGIPQANLIDVEETSIALPASPSQAKMDPLSTPAEKLSGGAPPHLRVRPRRSGPKPETQPILAPLESPANLSSTTAAKTIEHDKTVPDGKHMAAPVKANKLPPHLQVLSNTRATKGPIAVTTPLSTSQEKNNSYRPTINMDEEIAATQPILDIDEEIVAGLRADTDDPTAVAQLINYVPQETNEQVAYPSPQTGASVPKMEASAAESKPKFNNEATESRFDQRSAHNHSSSMRSNDFTVEPHPGTAQEARDATSKRKKANLASPPKIDAVSNGAESSVKKGKKPARELESSHPTSDLVGWDGKMIQPPVGNEWDHRQPFNPRNRDRLSVVKAWRDEHAADFEENNRVVVNTANPDFQTGEGLAAGNEHVLSPIDKREHETRAPNDDFTQARRHQSAADAMKDYGAKIAARPQTALSGIEGMTREEKRELRRALIEEERTRLMLPNPHAPAANIYLRPAEHKDMGQIAKIDNYYSRETNLVLHLDSVDEIYW